MKLKLSPFHGRLIVLTEEVRNDYTQAAIPGAISRKMSELLSAARLSSGTDVLLLIGVKKSAQGAAIARMNE